MKLRLIEGVPSTIPMGVMLVGIFNQFYIVTLYAKCVHLLLLTYVFILFKKTACFQFVFYFFHQLTLGSHLDMDFH